jgi:phosphotransferase system  glucose/maltose/N-acetylglucosamine-specific IIC component
MDLFLAICQALGLGLAVGALLGAFGPGGRQIRLVALVAAALGAALGALTVSALVPADLLNHDDDQSVLAGILVGAAAGWLGATVVASVVAGALRRSSGDAAGLTSLVVIASLALAGLAIIVPPVSLVVVVGLAWLALARRSRADRKYEGLRILR